MRAISLLICLSLVSLCWGYCDRTYIVEYGDSCKSIAEWVGVSDQDILDYNPFEIDKNCSNLIPGQEICVSFVDEDGEDVDYSLSTIYGIWHCGTDCSWKTKPDLSQSQWIINRGDGKPTADVVILSFLDPLALLNNQNSGGYTNGIPTGMIQSYKFFSDKGVKVLFSIGGQAWSEKFVQALMKNPGQLAKNAAAAAKKYNVGIEIDVEVDKVTYGKQLTTFVNTYRQLIPYNKDPNAPASSVLTMDVGAGTSYLGELAALARGFVKANKLNWVNAMVSDKPWQNINEATAAWQQHLAAGLPADRLVVSQYGSNTCANFQGLLQQTVQWAQSKKARGISFWAAGTGTNYVHDCKGIEDGSKAFIH